jgi:hypothetical protein
MVIRDNLKSGKGSIREPCRVGLKEDRAAAAKVPQYHLSPRDIVRPLSRDIRVCRSTRRLSGAAPSRYRKDRRWHAAPKVGFAVDSPLEGNGFENSVPRCLATVISVGAFIRR